MVFGGTTKLVLVNAALPVKEQTEFNPEHLETVASAYNTACVQLGLANIQDRLTEMIAARVIEAARNGERDADRLSDTH